MKRISRILISLLLCICLLGQNIPVFACPGNAADRIEFGKYLRMDYPLRFGSKVYLKENAGEFLYFFGKYLAADKQLPAIPSGDDEDYINELKYWFDCMGYTASGNIDWNEVINREIYIPYLFGGEETVFDSDTGITVKDAMKYIIVFSEMQRCMEIQDSKLQEDCNTTQMRNCTEKLLQILTVYTTYLNEIPATEYDPETVLESLSVFINLLEKSQDISVPDVNSYAKLYISIANEDKYEDMLDSALNGSSYSGAAPVLNEAVSYIEFIVDVNEANNGTRDEVMKTSLELLCGKLETYGTGSFKEIGEVFGGVLKVIDILGSLGELSFSVKAAKMLGKWYVDGFKNLFNSYKRAYCNWLFYMHYYAAFEDAYFYEQFEFIGSGEYSAGDFLSDKTISSASSDDKILKLLLKLSNDRTSSLNIWSLQDMSDESERLGTISAATFLGRVRKQDICESVQNLLAYIQSGLGSKITKVETESIDYGSGNHIEFSDDQDSKPVQPEIVSVPLSDLEYIKKAKYIAIDSFGALKDVNETEYEELILSPLGAPASLASEYAKTEDDAYITYYLNNKYSCFSGVIYRPYSSLSCETEWQGSTTFKVYGDEVLLYEGPNITQQTYDVIPFEVDVSGVREMKIVMAGTWAEKSEGWVGVYDRYPMLCISNLYLSNKEVEPALPQITLDSMGEEKTVTVFDGNLRMRQGPGTDYEVIQVIPDKTALSSYGEKNGWVYVRYAGSYGWVSGDYVK